MAKVEFIKEMPVTSTGAKQCLVKRDKEFFVVSSVHAMFTGYETLVFPADKDGEVTSWGRVAGGRGMSRNEAIEDLSNQEVEAWRSQSG